MKQTNLLIRSSSVLPISTICTVSIQHWLTGIRLYMFLTAATVMAFTQSNVVAQSSPETHVIKRTTTPKVTDLKSIYVLSRGLYDAGYYQNAVPYALQAYRQVIKLQALTTNSVVVTNNLAVIKFRLGEYKEARRLLKTVLVKLRAQKNKNTETIDRHLRTLYINLFELNMSARKLELADSNLNQTIKIDSQYFSATHPVLIHDKFLKIRLEFERGNMASSRQLLNRHLSSMPSGRLYNEARAEAGLLSAKIYTRAMQYDNAIKILKQALIWQGEGDTQLAADIYQQLALIYTKSKALNDLKRAKKYQHKQIEILRQLYGHNHPRIAQALVRFYYIKPDALSIKQKEFVREVYTRSFGPQNIRTLKILNRINNPSSVYSQVAL